MTTFVLIRHASHDLLGHTIVGRASGVGLSAQGLLEAEALVERFAPGAIDALYSSPLERARATAAAMAARLGLNVQIAEELNEIDYGVWTNRTLADLDELEEWRRFNLFRSGSRIPGGETMLEVQLRMLELIDRLCAEQPRHAIALVSHGDVIKATLAHFLGAPLDLFQRIAIDPASISVVRLQRFGPEVLLINGGAEPRLLRGAGT
ncbi:MAG TPA: histidine phosphatase family protein [Geminicoccaceae bacterium]|nr:histidine phosphatase family protein [Geminicoccaceae bacterium]